MEENPLNTKIKQEKVTPERELNNDIIEKLLDSNLFGEKCENGEIEDKKDIEPTK